MPQADGNRRPRVDWWWDGSDRGCFWALLVALAGAVVLFSLGVLLTAGGTPIRGVALANLGNGLGVVLLPTLIALRRLDHAQRLGEFGVGGDGDVRRALRPSLVMLGLVDERPPGARLSRPLPSVRPASWYRLLAACWAGFVLLDAAGLWVTARGLFAAQDTAELGVGVAVVALPLLLAWLLVGLVALRKAARIAHRVARAERGAVGRRARATRQPLRRRLAAGGRRAAGATLAGWRGLGRGVATAARWTAEATLDSWRELQRGVADGARWAAGATLAGWRELEPAVASGVRWAAGATEAGWRELKPAVASGSRRAAGATRAGWHGLRRGVATGTRWAAGAAEPGWRELRSGVAAAALQAAGVAVAGWRGLRSGMATGASRVAARVGDAPGRPLGRRLADDGRRAADVTLARWRGLESGSRR